jgi:hypothetical protein
VGAPWGPGGSAQRKFFGRVAGLMPVLLACTLLLVLPCAEPDELTQPYSSQCALP